MNLVAGAMGKYLVFLISIATYGLLHCCTASTVVEWIPGSSASIADFDPAGDEPDVNIPISLMCVCRATITLNDSSGTKTAVVPGKYFFTGPVNGTAFVTFRGKSYTLTMDQVELLSYPRGVVSWVPKEGILFSTKFVVGGFDPDTLQPMYICRGIIDPPGNKPAGLILGRYENGVCTIELSGAVEVRTQFEVLSVNAFGLYHNVGDGA